MFLLLSKALYNKFYRLSNYLKEYRLFTESWTVGLTNNVLKQIRD